MRGKPTANTLKGEECDEVTVNFLYGLSCMCVCVCVCVCVQVDAILASCK